MPDTSPYEVLEQIGQGGMGEVYKARDRHLDRLVAIKVLRPDLCSEERLIKRFKREAALAARLNHPNIVTLFGVDYADDTYRIIMEYVEGMSFAKFLSRMGAQEPQYAIELIKQAADALSEAHSKDLIHRDIKPGNIMLSNRGEVKVTDFGLARAFREESDLTTDGARLGTPRYMSPEQVEAAPLTPHSDIYALGVVLFELLAGKPAFKEADPLALMHRIVEGPFPDIRGINSRATGDVPKIIAKMTARNPLDRYRSARRLSADLATWLKRGVAPGVANVVLQHEGSPKYAGSGYAPSKSSIMIRGEETDFILHHVASDNAWADWISVHLKEAGYKTELALWDFKKSHESLRQLIKAADRRTCIIAVVSPTYLKALHGDRKWSHAYYQGDLTALPVVVQSCFLGTAFRTNYYIDLCELNPDEGKKALLDEAVEVRGLPDGDAGAALDTMLKSITPTKLRHTVWNVPFEQEPRFVGRADILNSIYAKLSERGGMCTLVQGDSADAGLGLTQIAVEYAHLNKANYSVVWWIRALRQETLLTDFTALAAEIGLPEKDNPKLVQQAKAVKHWLANNSGWLLVFDNARSLDYITSLLPKSITGHIIMSTSRSQWSSTANPVIVPALSRSESVDLLFQLTKERNEGAAAALASCLSDVPLALHLAAGFIVATRMNMDQYIDLFLDRHKALWGIHAPPMTAAAIVTTAISLSVERVAVQSAGALGLLKACSYLAPTDIPLTRLCSGAQAFPKSLAKILQNTAKLNEAIALLKSYKLLDERNDAIWLHHSVQQLVRTWVELDIETEKKPGRRTMAIRLQGARFERKDRHAWANATLEFVAQALPEDPRGAGAWAAFERLVPQTTAVLRHATRLEAAPVAQADVWMRVARYHVGRLDHERALQAYTKAIDLNKQVYGEQHERVSRLYKELAHMNRSRGDLQRARINYELALGIDEKLHRGSHVDVSANLFNLGSVFLQLGDKARARQYYMRALETDLKAQGKMSADAGRDYTYLGLVSQELGDLTAAWEYYRQALEICEEVFGETHERVSAAVKNLAGLLRKLGDLANAKEHYKRAIHIDVELYGEQHPDVAQDYNNLGIVEEHMSLPRSAKDHYMKALEINRAVCGDGHLKVAINKNNIANMMRQQGELEGAIKYYTQAEEVFLATLGKHHEHSRTASRNLKKLRLDIRQQDAKKSTSAE